MRLLAVVLAMTLHAPGSARAADEGDDYPHIVGQPALAWDVKEWLNSPPLTLQGLRGKAVLIRWWTGPGCVYCEASLPRLVRLHERYHDKGLVVIGFYHEKHRRPLPLSRVKELADGFGLKFPVAVDSGWMNLKRWWLDRKPPENLWTSALFLIGPDGIVSYLKPGGSVTEEYAKEIEAQVRRALGL